MKDNNDKLTYNSDNKLSINVKKLKNCKFCPKNAEIRGVEIWKNIK